MKRCVTVFAVILMVGLNTVAAEISDEEAIEIGRDGLADSANYPWYDANDDGLRPAELKDSQEPFQPYDWELKKNKPAKRNFNSQGIWAVIQGFAWALLIAIFVLLGYFAFRSFFGLQSSEDDFEEEYDEIERIAQLPYPIRKPSQDLLEEAKFHYEQGRYSEAIVYLFSYQLIQLDKAHLIHLTKGKTNRQYLAEIRRLPELPKIVADTMLTFEDAFFGHYAITKERFESCWSRLTEFAGQLEEANAG